MSALVTSIFATIGAVFVICAVIVAALHLLGVIELGFNVEDEE